MAEFAQDHSKSPPPSGPLEAFLRRFARFSYGIVVLLVYVLASAALGLALAPVLWGWHRLWGKFPVLPRPEARCDVHRKVTTRELDTVE